MLVNGSGTISGSTSVASTRYDETTGSASTREGSDGVGNAFLSIVTADDSEDTDARITYRPGETL
jgi:hypothetical protein